MPTYEYHCENCHQKIEVFQKITDKPLVDCGACGKSTLRRGPGGGVGLLFKGPGFYINDYKKEGSQDNNSGPSTSGGGCCPCGKNTPCT